MTNAPFEDVDDLEDVETVRYVDRMLERDDVSSFDDVRERVRYRSRDNARTPMQWSDEENAGFTAGEPWLLVNPNYPEINVADARAEADSIWQYYRRLIELRREHPVFVYGRYRLCVGEHPQIYAYRRVDDDERALVALNFSGEPVRFTPPEDLLAGDARLLVANYDVTEPATVEGDWRPYEARVYLDG